MSNDDVIPISVFAILLIFLLAFLWFGVRQDNENNEAIDKLCASYAMSGKEYSETQGRTILSERMCVDTKSGQVFDPAFMRKGEAAR